MNGNLRRWWSAACILVLSGSRVRAGSGEPAGQAGGYRQAGLDLRQDGRRESPGREGDRAGEEGRPARLLMFGGDWCGWCHKLHELFASNREIRKTLSDEYVLVTIDLESPNGPDLLKRCKEALSKEEFQKGVGYPFLAVLDAEGKVVTAQRTDLLEEGDHHDPKRVQEFLDRWKIAPKDAKLVLEEALSRASSDDKRVLLTFGDPWCGWCHKLHDWLAQPEIATILDRDFIVAQVDVNRMTGGKDVMSRYRPDASGGIPWFAILDAKGKPLTTSDGAVATSAIRAAPGDRPLPVDGQRTGTPHRRPPVGSASEIPGGGRGTSQAAVTPLRVRPGVAPCRTEPAPRLARGSGLRKGPDGRLLVLMDLDDLGKSDDLRPDAHVRVHVAEPHRTLPFLGAFHQLEQGRVSHTAEVDGPAQVHQDRLTHFLFGDRHQLDDELFGSIRALNILAHHLDDHDAIDVSQAEVFEVRGGHRRALSGGTSESRQHDVLRSMIIASTRFTTLQHPGLLIIDQHGRRTVMLNIRDSVVVGDTASRLLRPPKRLR